jgi:hypothetical protein
MWRDVGESKNLSQRLRASDSTGTLLDKMAFSLPLFGF